MSSLLSHLSGSGSKTNKHSGKTQNSSICKNCQEVFLDKELNSLHTAIDCARNRQKKKRKEEHVDEAERDVKNLKTVKIEKKGTCGSSEGVPSRSKPPRALLYKSKSKPDKTRFNSRSQSKEDKIKSSNGGASQEYVDCYSDEYTEIDLETLFDNNGNTARQNERTIAAVNEELSKMIAFSETTTSDTEFCNEDVQNNNEILVQSGIDNSVIRKAYSNENIGKSGIESVKDDQSNVSKLQGFMDWGPCVRILRRSKTEEKIGITKNWCANKTALEKDLVMDNLKLVHRNNATRDPSIKNKVMPRLKECDVKINRISETDFRKMKNCFVMIKGLDKKFLTVLGYLDQESVRQFSVQKSGGSGRSNKISVLSQDNAGEEMCDIQENTKDNGCEEMIDIQENTKDNEGEEMFDIQENTKGNGSEEMIDHENTKDNGGEELYDNAENSTFNFNPYSWNSNHFNTRLHKTSSPFHGFSSDIDDNVECHDLRGMVTGNNDVENCENPTLEERHTFNFDVSTPVDSETEENHHNCSFSTESFYSARSNASSSFTNDTYDSAMDETPIQSHFVSSDEEDIEKHIELVPKIKIKRNLSQGILGISTQKRKAYELMEFENVTIIGNNDSMSNTKIDCTLDTAIGSSSNVGYQLRTRGDTHSDIPQNLTKRKSKQWRPYTKEEDDKIVEYMKENGMSGRQRGRRSWQVMEGENVCPGRSWQSMKERWIKHIELKLNKSVANENGIN